MSYQDPSKDGFDMDKNEDRHFSGSDHDSRLGNSGSSDFAINLPSEVQEMVDSLFSGKISQEDAQKLVALLKSDPGLRAAYQQQAFVHSTLLWMHGNAEGQNTRKVDPLFIADRLLESERALLKQQQDEAAKHAEEAAREFEELQAAQELERNRLAERARHATRALYGTCAALAVAVLLLLAIAPAIMEQPVAMEQGENAGAELPEVVAVLESSVDANWAEGRVFLEGQQLLAGDYHLIQGFAKVIYDHGAEIIVEAPARFALESPMEMKLESGKIVGLCPTEDSYGFTVVAHDFQVTDLGTEFGVQVLEDRKSLVQVFDGLVEFASSIDRGAQTGLDEQLSSGQALEIDVESGEAALVAAESLTFVRSEEFDVRQDASKGDIFAQWRLQSYELRRDPAMLLYYAFDDESRASAKLVNQAKEFVGQHNGVIENASWASGRYPGKHALSFVVDESNRVENSQHVTVEGSDGDPFAFGKQSFSVGVWFSFRGSLATSMREGPDSAEDYSPLLSKGYGSWRLQWHIPTQSMVWDINTLPIDRSRNRLSAKPSAVDEAWHFAAAVVEWDTGSGRPEHRIYFDGQQKDVRTWDAGGLQSNNQPVTIGNNSGRQSQVFNGLIDEVMVFERALNDTEVRAIYDLSYTALEGVSK